MSFSSTLAYAAAAASAAALIAYAVGRSAERRKHRDTNSLSPSPIVGSATQLLPGRVLVVTGGSSGIWREIALSAAEHGAKVLIVDVTDQPLEGGVTTVAAAAQRLTGAAAGEVAFMIGDTTLAATHANAVAECVARWGKLDVWVNNAAIGVGGGALDAKEADWCVAAYMLLLRLLLLVVLLFVLLLLLISLLPLPFRDRVMAINAKGYWMGARAAATQFLKQEPSPSR